jgi:hypothetical protein
MGRTAEGGAAPLREDGREYDVRVGAMGDDLPTAPQSASGTANPERQ